MRFIPVSVKSKVLALGTVCVFVSAASPARAALGGDITSVQSDQVHMEGTIRTTAKSSYAVHEIQSSAGTVVREYVASTGSSAGKVFAVGLAIAVAAGHASALGKLFRAIPSGG